MTKLKKKLPLIAVKNKEMFQKLQRKKCRTTTKKRLKQL